MLEKKRKAESLESGHKQLKTLRIDKLLTKGLG